MDRHTRYALAGALILALVPLGTGRLRAQASAHPRQIPGPVIAEPAGPYKGFTFVGPPPDFRRKSRGTHDAGPASFIVTYNGFTPQAQAAFQYAVDIWASVVRSPVPIRVTAAWRTDLPSYVLGAAGAAIQVRDFPNAPRANTYYPAALANARAGVDQYAGEDIVANFNANFDWYLGTDGNARTQYDFVTVVLHELGHGLGLYGSLRVESGNGVWGTGSPATPLAYDWFMAAGTGRALLDSTVFPNGSPALGAQLVSNDVHFEGGVSRASNGGTAPFLFAPSPWAAGSSISHLSDTAYPNGDLNSLMTPSIALGEVVHDPGPVTRAMLADMGWVVAGLPEPPAQAPPKAPTNVRVTAQ